MPIAMALAQTDRQTAGRCKPGLCGQRFAAGACTDLADMARTSEQPQRGGAVRAKPDQRCGVHGADESTPRARAGGGAAQRRPLPPIVP